MDPQINQPQPTQPSETPPSSTLTPPAPVSPESHNTSAEKSGSKLPVVIAVIVLILLAGAVGYAATHKKKVATSNITTQSGAYGANEQPEDNSLQTEAELADYKIEAEITITDTTLSPQDLIVPNGAKIIWHNTGAKARTFAITPGTTVPNKMLSKFTVEAGNGYPYVIHQTGTFHYYDVDNPTVTGTFTV